MRMVHQLRHQGLASGIVEESYHTKQERKCIQYGHGCSSSKNENTGTQSQYKKRYLCAVQYGAFVVAVGHKPTPRPE